MLPRAIARAAALAEKDRSIYGVLKRGMYRETIEIMERGEL